MKNYQEELTYLTEKAILDNEKFQEAYNETNKVTKDINYALATEKVSGNSESTQKWNNFTEKYNDLVQKAETVMEDTFDKKVLGYVNKGFDIIDKTTSVLDSVNNKLNDIFGNDYYRENAELKSLSDSNINYDYFKGEETGFDIDNIIKLLATSTSDFFSSMFSLYIVDLNKKEIFHSERINNINLPKEGFNLSSIEFISSPIIKILTNTKIRSYESTLSLDIDDNNILLNWFYSNLFEKKDKVFETVKSNLKLNKYKIIIKLLNSYNEEYLLKSDKNKYIKKQLNLFYFDDVKFLSTPNISFNKNSVEQTKSDISFIYKNFYSIKTDDMEILSKFKV